MAQAVWKFPLKPGKNIVNMPADSGILCVRMLGEDAFLWAEITLGGGRIFPNVFHVVKTGEEIPHHRGGGEKKYVGTVFYEGASPTLVFHVYHDLGETTKRMLDILNGLSSMPESVTK